METGESLILTDGKGAEALAKIAEAGKKKCTVRIENVNQHLPRKPALHIGVAFTKNASRNEWILEKVTEMGVASITPLMVQRTERERMRYDRWQGILISAMLQSQQYHLPKLHEAANLSQAFGYWQEIDEKFIAHCINGEPRRPFSKALEEGKDAVIAIGPEGDFTTEEVTDVLERGFKPVTLGINRLRTETAAVAACGYFNLLNDESR